MCADINNGISKQASAMESAYAGLSSFLTSLDKRSVRSKYVFIFRSLLFIDFCHIIILLVRFSMFLIV